MNKEKITKLDLRNKSLIKIEGLEEFYNLESLYLSNNKIKEITGLETLEKLRFLSLDNNEISKMQGFENLKNLRTLSLNNNQIETIEGLEKLTKLTSLNLNNNNIKQISGLENLESLEILSLVGNQIKCLKGLETNNNLQFLYLNDNNLEIINDLKANSKLRMLYLKGNSDLPRVFEQDFKEFTYSRNKLEDYFGLTKNQVEELFELKKLEQAQRDSKKRKELREQMELNSIPPTIRDKFVKLLKNNQADQCLYCGRKLSDNRNWEDFVRNKIEEIIVEANRKLPRELRDKITVELEETYKYSRWKMSGPAGAQKWVDRGPGINLQLNKIKREKRHAYFFSAITALKGTICQNCAENFVQNARTVFSKVKATKSPKAHKKMFFEIIEDYYQLFELMVDNAYSK